MLIYVKSFQETEHFKKRAKQRYIVEAKNAELKQAHGLDKSCYLGLSGIFYAYPTLYHFTERLMFILIREMTTMLKNYYLVAFQSLT